MRDKLSRYQPLIDFLAMCEQAEVVLTFKEIAAMIGGPLPESAIITSSWWTNKTTSHVAAWHAHGWQARRDWDHLRVTFTRDAEEGRDE